jgi:hypothetical protein
VEALRARLGPLYEQQPDLVARVERMAPEMYAKDAAETWGLLVQAWRGRTFEVGREYLSDSEVPVPTLSGAKVRIHATFRVARRLRCPSGGACVEARMRSEPDSHDIARAVKRLVGEMRLPVAEAERTLGEMPVAVDVALVTDPATLAPYRLELTRTTRAPPKSDGPDGAKPLDGKDVTVYTFVYALPSER